MSTFVLQLKGDQSFSLFSQVTDAESLSQTWRLCTKISAHLEEGERLENLSWRLFHLHSVMAGETSKGDTRTFKRLSEETGQRLDREKHLRISQLTAPRLRTDLQSKPQPPAVSETLHHPTVVCSISKNSVDGLTANSFITRNAIAASNSLSTAHVSPYNLDLKAGPFNFESFLSGFSPLALLSAVDCYSETRDDLLNLNPQDLNRTSGPCTLASENVGIYSNLSDAFPPPELYTTDRPMSVTTEIRSLDQENLFPSSSGWENSSLRSSFSEWSNSSTLGYSPMPSSPSSLTNSTTTFKCVSTGSCPPSLDEKVHPHFNPSAVDGRFPANGMMLPLSSLYTKCDPPHHENVGEGTSELYSAFTRFPEPPSARFNDRRKRRNPMATRPPTFTGLSELSETAGSDRSGENPICFNCRGTQTPLWRRGPDDELLCNACGVFYKVHKRNRPDTLKKAKNIGGNTEMVTFPPNTASIKCANCHAVATPMWRKAPDGRLLCNACALYFKCHKRPRPTHANRMNSPYACLNPVSHHSQIAAMELPHTTLAHMTQRTKMWAGPCYGFPEVKEDNCSNQTNVAMATHPCTQLKPFPLI